MINVGQNMKPAIPKLIAQNIDRWASCYDDPARVRAAIAKHAARVFTAEAEGKATPATITSNSGR